MSRTRSSDSKVSEVTLVCGEDDFQVKQRGRRIYQEWCERSPGMDNEIIDAQVTNGGDALAALSKLREALNTFPFFGSSKVVWFQNCSFLGDDRTASSQAVTSALAEFAQELKGMTWENIRLLITAGKVDKRKSIYKTIDKTGKVESYAGWSIDDRNWSFEAEQMVRDQIKSLGKEIDSEAAARLVNWVGPNTRDLSHETDKVALYCGDRSKVLPADVDAVVTRHKHSRAFALGDALGARTLPNLLRILDEELWQMRIISQKSEIGLLYGLISKVRVMMFLKELLRSGALKAGSDFNRFKVQLAQLPSGMLPEDKRFNALSLNPYVLFKSLPHAANYTLSELINAMDLLLKCNQRLIFSGLEGALILQQTLIRIVSGANTRLGTAPEAATHR